MMLAFGAIALAVAFLSLAGPHLAQDEASRFARAEASRFARAGETDG